MLTGPQIEMPVRCSLHFATTRKVPIAVKISSPEHMSEQKEQIGLRELSLDAARANREPPRPAGISSYRRPLQTLSQASTETRIFVNLWLPFKDEAAPPAPRAPPPLTTSRERRDQWPTDNYDFLPPKFNRPQQTGRGYGPVLASRG